VFAGGAIADAALGLEGAIVGILSAVAAGLAGAKVARVLRG